MLAKTSITTRATEFSSDTRLTVPETLITRGTLIFTDFSKKFRAVVIAQKQFITVVT